MSIDERWFEGEYRRLKLFSVCRAVVNYETNGRKVAGTHLDSMFCFVPIQKMGF